MLNMPFAEVASFIGRQRSIGRYNKNTALAREAACARIATVLEPEQDTVGYVKDHLSDLVRRYGNKNPKVGKGSLETYRSRVEKAIEDFIGHKTDANWEPRTRGSRIDRRSKASPPPPTAVEASQPTNTDPVVTLLGGLPANATALRHRFPLRPDFDVEILLPRDFTAKEAKRLTTWISALANAFTDEGQE